MILPAVLSNTNLKLNVLPDCQSDIAKQGKSGETSRSVRQVIAIFVIESKPAFKSGQTAASLLHIRTYGGRITVS